ncbi:MAG: zinc-binding alcohol dehydrogenase family protein [Chloroflexi bacterium]|nr:zinc-binding alcohol dehydrogenase family protein [Chloroflexota bacterium]
MQAISHSEYGGLEVLQFVTVPTPTLQPRDLLVRVKAFAVNPVDAKRRRAGNAPLTFPKILGFDSAGIVEQVGPEVSLFHVGEEVFFAGDATRQGCYAEFVAIDERIVGHKPKTLSFAEAAAIPLTGLTAWEAFFEQMHLEPKPNVNRGTPLIFGGAGGVGSIAIQIAKRVANMHVIATASRPASIEYCRRMGTDEVVDHSQELGPQLRALGLDGVDYILNCNEVTNISLLAVVLNPMGTICNIVGGDAAKSIDASLVFAKRGTLTFELMFARSRLKIEMERQGQILNRLAELLDQKILVSTMTQRMDWKKIQEAHRQIESGHTLGKIVLDVSS